MSLPGGGVCQKRWRRPHERGLSVPKEPALLRDLEANQTAVHGSRRFAQSRCSCPEPRNRGHADVVRSGEVFERHALRAALAGFRLLLRGERRRAAHMLAARLGAAPALRRAGADKIALNCRRTHKKQSVAPNQFTPDYQSRLQPLFLVSAHAAVAVVGGQFRVWRVHHRL
jgi:hypothetical protein